MEEGRRGGEEDEDKLEKVAFWSASTVVEEGDVLLLLVVLCNSSDAPVVVQAELTTYISLANFGIDGRNRILVFGMNERRIRVVVKW